MHEKHIARGVFGILSKIHDRAFCERANDFKP